MPEEIKNVILLVPSGCFMLDSRRVLWRWLQNWKTASAMLWYCSGRCGTKMGGKAMWNEALWLSLPRVEIEEKKIYQGDMKKQPDR